MSKPYNWANDKYYQEAKAALDKQPYGPPAEERQRLAEWMASSQSFQAAYTQVLEQLKQAEERIRLADARAEEYRRQLALKDESFRPPKLGLA